MSVKRLRFTEKNNDNKIFKIGALILEHNERKKDDEDIPILSSTMSGIYLQNTYFTKNTASDNTLGYKKVPRGFFTYRSMSDTGAFTFNIQNMVDIGIVSPAYPVFRTKNIDHRFFYYYLNNSNKFKSELLKSKQGGTRYALSISLFKELNVNIPSTVEQVKIGNFLSLFDRLIEKIETKIELLKELKKGYLQQMFPAKGEKVPKIRFEGFDEDWELKQYNDVLIERREIAPESEKYPLMSFIAEHGVVKKSDRYNREFLVKDEYKKYKRTLFGDFIYSSNNLTTGSIGLNKFGDASISPVYSIFLTKKNYYFHFISEYLTLNYNIFKMLRYRQGVVYGQYRIPESDFLKIKSRFPNFSEQQKIGNYFKLLDAIIEAHDREMNTIERFKKGYMQRLFV